MEDEAEEKLFYQVYMTHAKMAASAGYGVGAGAGSTTATLRGRLARVAGLSITHRSELIVFTIFVCITLALLQGVLLYRHVLLHTISRVASLITSNRIAALPASDSTTTSGDSNLSIGNLGVYAVQGRRSHMEDRYSARVDLAEGQITIAAVFDGHGGDAAADFANNKFIPALCTKIEQAVTYAKDPESAPACPVTPTQVPPSPAMARKKSFKKTGTDDSGKTEISDPELIKKLSSVRNITRDSNVVETASVQKPAQCYVNSSSVDFGKMMTDELLSADHELLKEFRVKRDVAGSTALLALMHDNKLTVANVGDSRGVMCDKKGNAIPLSFDHKPQQMREQKRIKEAGGFISFLGVWRVAGILATSRALGDYPLKDKNYVIADPDILTFNLVDHKPQFIILATDGLWDTFTNEEAVNFIKDRLDEPFYGAKSLVQESYKRGSLDNITVMVINLKDHTYA